MDNESTKMPTAPFVVVQKEAHGIVILKLSGKLIPAAHTISLFSLFLYKKEQRIKRIYELLDESHKLS